MAVIVAAIFVVAGLTSTILVLGRDPDSTQHGRQFLAENQTLSIPARSTGAVRVDVVQPSRVAYTVTMPVDQFVQVCFYGEADHALFQAGAAVAGLSCDAANVNAANNVVGPLSVGGYYLGLRNPWSMPVSATFSIWAEAPSQGVPLTANPGPAATATAAQSQVRRVYIYEVPSYVADPVTIRSVVSAGINEWSSRGYEIQEVANPSDATIRVQFIKEWGTEVLGQTYSSNFIQVGLGDSKCNQKWTPFSATSVHWIATHEFGHSLGKDHSTNPNDVMYPTFDYTYGEPCEMAKGELDVPAYTYRGWMFTLGKTSRVDYETRDVDSGSFAVCIFTQSNYSSWVNGNRAPGWGCHDQVNWANDGATLAAGTYVLGFYCQNYVDNCLINYRLTR